MLRLLVSLLVVVPVFVATAAGADFKKPTKTPVATTAAHKALVDEGTALHDRADYDGAISRYQRVLAENPDDVLALYELSFSLLAKKDYARAVEVATRGAEYVSDSLGKFYVVIGNALDESGKTDDAVKAYKAGLKFAPDDAFLHFNLAITYLRHDRREDGRASLKAAASAGPSYSSPHLLLATTLFQDGYKVPALLAAARFLTLEPGSERAERALGVLDEVLRGGVTTGADPKHINITVDMNAKKDEGDFSTLDLALGLTKAAGTTEENTGKTEAQKLVDQVDSFLAILGELGTGKNGSTFSYRYYVPYFMEMKERGFVEPFVYYTHQQSDLPGVGVWLHDHDDRVKAFLAWSSAYAWPRVSK